MKQLRNASYEAISESFYKVYDKAHTIVGTIDETKRRIDPLYYYIASARIPAFLLKAFCNLSTRQLNHIATILCNDYGCDDRVMAKVKAYLYDKAAAIGIE